MKNYNRNMDIEEAEKQLYFEYLQSFYGKNILDREDLDPSRQSLYEDRRHEFNSNVQLDSENMDIVPGRLLISVTQKCPSHCAHCWVFGSPLATCSLSTNELQAIYNHTLSDRSPGWTLSGGEFFILPHHAEILERFPVQCIYTNGYWGHPAGKCSLYIENFKNALNKNPVIDKSRFYLILSYDRYHREGIGSSFPLATAVARIIHSLYEIMPEISIRISHIEDHLIYNDNRYLVNYYRASTQLKPNYNYIRCSNNKNDFHTIIHELEDMGYECEKTERNDKNFNINTLSFSYSKTNGMKKELFVDIFPATPVCRALFLCKPEETPLLKNPGKNSLADLSFEHTTRRYHYTIGPDGGVGLYEILYAPPVPYRLGNLIHQPWETIEKRILHDPIAMTLRTKGLSPFIRFMETYYQDIFQAISGHIKTIQQFLYLVLLNPGRKLLLNTYLLEEFTATHENGLREKINNCLETKQVMDRDRNILDLYGVN
ncbi:MAG: hypothetical protein JXB88_19290 [Spirochaetales bacterium]|nr:hypothetical protein [Spirochaetales bacterium]